MDSVIIVAPRDYDAELRARLATRWTPSESEDGVWAIEDDGQRVYVSRNNYVRDELDQERLRRITAIMPDPVFYTIDFSDVDLCRRVLLSVADDSSLLVDNDRGVLLSGAEFIQVLLNQPGWDWRVNA